MGQGPRRPSAGSVTLGTVVKSGASSEYLEPSGGCRRRRRRSWLRTARLNVVGWSALLGACLVAAALGLVSVTALVATLTRRRLRSDPGGRVVFADRRRWARMETGFGWGGSMEEVTRIADELEAEGVHVRVSPEAVGSAWDDRADSPPDRAAGETAFLEYRNRDAEVVMRKLREHGVHPPDVL